MRPPVTPKHNPHLPRTTREANSASQSEDTPTAIRAPRVLVVEDALDIRKVIRFLLESAGYDVTAVRDGESVADMIRTWSMPDLVVLDRVLPDLSGDELIAQIRADSRWASVPIIVVSGKNSDQEVAEAMNAGANDYVVKPFMPKNFLEVVGRYA